MTQRGSSAGSAYAEIPVAAQIHSAQRSTPEEILAIGKKIWDAVGRSGVAASDDAGNEALLERFQTEQQDFAASFPLVLRWMVQARSFHIDAFRKFLLKHATAKLSSRQAFLELQAEYLVLLYRENHAHADERRVKQYRDQIVSQLLDEDKAFEAIQKEVEADLAQRATTADLDRKQQLYEYLLAQKVARERAAGAQ